jgi:hypothetical protein
MWAMKMNVDYEAETVMENDEDMKRVKHPLV